VKKYGFDVAALDACATLKDLHRSAFDPRHFCLQSKHRKTLHLLTLASAPKLMLGTFHESALKSVLLETVKPDFKVKDWICFLDTKQMDENKDGKRKVDELCSDLLPKGVVGSVQHHSWFQTHDGVKTACYFVAPTTENVSQAIAVLTRLAKRRRLVQDPQATPDESLQVETKFTVR